MPSSNESRRRKAEQKKKRKKKREQKRRASSSPTEERTETRYEKRIRHRDAFGTLAHRWPIRYRRLRFDRLPDLSESINLAGSDLHLEWFPSQEARRSGEGGEVVAALEIERCDLVGEYGEQEVSYRCFGTLTEHAQAESTYGQWLRLQMYSSVEEGCEYRVVPVEFQVSMLKPTLAMCRERNKFLTEIEQVPLLPNVWNVALLSFGSELQEKGCALTLDRLYELMMMLRICVPRSLGARRFKQEIEFLETRLEFIEQAERAAAESLKARSEAVQEYLDSESPRLQERVVENNALEVARREVEEEVRLAEDAVTLAEERSDAKALAEARRQRSNAWTRRVNTIEQQENAAREFEEFGAKLEAEFMALCKPEWDAANTFTRQLFFWQELWQELEYARQTKG